MDKLQEVWNIYFSSYNDWIQIFFFVWQQIIQEWKSSSSISSQIFYACISMIARPWGEIMSPFTSWGIDILFQYWVTVAAVLQLLL